jgi:SpoIID/LytB domain protein
MLEEPIISVGIMDRKSEVEGRMRGDFSIHGSPGHSDDSAGFSGAMTGRFRARPGGGVVELTNETGRVLARSATIRLQASPGAVFELFGVQIGKQFHWERPEDQAFRGNLVLKTRQGNTIVVINEIPLEGYLESVVSSEMSASAPVEFLKAHAILSRSWLLSALERKVGLEAVSAPPLILSGAEGEIVRWYEREDHDMFDVCADDHCQRYQGITKIFSAGPEQAVKKTRGIAVTYEGSVCDARYAKACGGLTEEFRTAWDDRTVPYLKSISDGPEAYRPIADEASAAEWILSSPRAYCGTTDSDLLRTVLPDFDQETKSFFRWTVEYTNGELCEILREKSGIDFGEVSAIEPVLRGPSARIMRLRITGSKRSIVVGKELEIRRWLSKNHLYSSAFLVEKQADEKGGAPGFRFRGAGWGHGVGLCQIGAAVMASRGFSAEEILKHYFVGADIREVY